MMQKKIDMKISTLFDLAEEAIMYYSFSFLMGEVVKLSFQSALRDPPCKTLHAL